MLQIISCLLLTFLSAFGDDLTVQVKNGQLKGYEMESFKGRQFRAFTGIPFAKPPVGDLRFKSPEPSEDWEGVKEATATDKVCMQNKWTPPYFTGSEDCLYLNVFAPKEINTSLPVLVYVHGGAFCAGSGLPQEYGPHLFMDHEVVLVTFNYRLGPMGFLTTGDTVVPGNAGLKDQIMALKWVKENIEAFGGDSESVTIFGESAGGASVHFLLLSPLSQGLFHAAIIQSGTAYCQWALHEDGQGEPLAAKLAELLSCPTNNSQEIVDCLRQKSAEDIMMTRQSFFQYNELPIVVFKPTVEVSHEGAFLPDHPQQIIESGKAVDVPIIIGLNRDEGCILAAPLYMREGRMADLEENFDEGAPIAMGYEEVNVSSVLPKLKKFYVGDKKLTEANRKNVSNMFMDAMFMHCTDKAVLGRRWHSNQPTYYYLLEHVGEFSISLFSGDKNNSFGVCHADDVHYMMYITSVPIASKLTGKDAEVSNFFLTRWVNFAKFKNPNGEDDLFAKWEPITTGDLAYMSIDGVGGIKMSENMFEERVFFWRMIRKDEKTSSYYVEDIIAYADASSTKIAGWCLAVALFAVFFHN